MESKSTSCLSSGPPVTKAARTTSVLHSESSKWLLFTAVLPVHSLLREPPLMLSV